jgi:hypothetical protein
MSETQTNQNEEVTETAEQQPAPELNINDLLSMRGLIDVVTQRGAFKAAELSGVGMLYDKLNRFLEAAQQQQQQQAPQGE